MTEKTGALIAIKSVTDNDDMMIMTEKGIAIRMSVNDIRVMGRATQGVRLINLKDNDRIASVAKAEKMDESKTDEEAETTTEE